MNVKPCGANQFWFLSLVGVILTTRLAAGSAQTGPALASLTVPEKNLPPGCRLRLPGEVVPPRIVDGSVMAAGSGLIFDPFPTNPWAGADRRLLIEIRESIDGRLRLPDAPPPERAEQSRLKQRWVADVVEGYRAVYFSGDDFIWVSAMRFNDARLANAGPWGEGRVVIGATVVQIRGDSTMTCYRAIDAHIRALK